MRHARPALLLVARPARCATSRVTHQNALGEVSLGRVPRRSLPLFQVVFVVVYFFSSLLFLSFVGIDSRSGSLESQWPLK